MNLNRTVLLKTMIRHETLTFDSLGKAENLGFEPNCEHLQFLLSELTESGHLTMLADVVPATYTITSKGIEEGERLSGEQQSI